MATNKNKRTIQKSPSWQRHTWQQPGFIAFIVIFAAVGAFFLLHSFAATPNYDKLIRSENPVAYWAMNGTDGEEHDLTGNRNLGKYQGGTPKLTTMPNGDKAADFNGVNQYLTIPSNKTFSISTYHSLTWEAWIRPDTLQYPHASSEGYVMWMGKCQDHSPTCEWGARTYSSSNSVDRCNRLSAYVYNPTAGLGSGAFWQPTCGLLQAKQWLYVVGEYQTKSTPDGCDAAEPGSINIWVNGVRWNQSLHRPTGCMSQYQITPKAGNSPLNIGTMDLDTWFPGAIGKVAIYNHLLSQDQIDAHYATMTGSQPSGSCSETCTIPVPTP